jgi:MFS family permease
MPANDSKTNYKKSPQSLKAVWPALAGLSAVFLFEMLDNSILNVALPTIGRDLRASATSLQWITSAYAIVFGGLMLAFGALADKYGRRKVMLIGLSMLGVASFSTFFVRNPGELIAVRVLIGIAAAMTTPGTISLAFRLFDDDKLRIRAISAITTVGLIGLAAGPIVGGFLLSVLPWQALLLINVPIAFLAFLGIRAGISPEKAEELHRVPIDIMGAILGTATIVFAIVAPTLFVEKGGSSALPWIAVGAAVISALLFVVRERSATHPLIDAKLLSQPLVSGGLAYKAATGLAIAGLGYIISLQFQLDWGWSPLRASIAMLPQVMTLLLSGFFVEKFVGRFGIQKAAWFGSLSVLAGLVIFGAFGQVSYLWVALTLVLIAAGLRVVGVVSGVNVMKGTPKNRTSIGAALVDTTDEITSALSIALSGTILAAIFVGDITKAHWSDIEKAQFHRAVSLSTWILTAVATALIAWAFVRTRRVELADPNTTRTI